MADTPEAKKSPPTDLLQQAVARDDVPKIYANGFGVGLTNADIIIIFQRFGPNPVAVVNLSYTLAKTLAQRLGALVSEFEAKVACQEILTTDRIDAATAAAKRSQKSDDVH